MSSISIIGTGNMARAIGALAVAGGNTVEVIGRDQSKAAELAKTLGGGARTGEFGAVPAGVMAEVWNAASTRLRVRR
jgi:8-hydroxy-5-deazaflavin:NADPH oxidoreductase